MDQIDPISAEIKSIAIANQGKLIFFGCDDKSIKIYELNKTKGYFLS